MMRAHAPLTFAEAPHSLPTPLPRSTLRTPLRQDAAMMREVAEYFNRAIPEIRAEDEDAFISALNQAGLTDQTA